MTDIRHTMAGMGRWQPDSRARLHAAAMELYERDGFEQTTVAAVAERAGLTERTFFRYFPDKREVLFSNENELRARLMAAVVAIAADRSIRDAIMAGLDAVANELQPRREELRRREEIVALHAELRERELIKLASWTAALDEALRVRGGVTEMTAKLAASIAIAVFAIATQRWIAEPLDASLSHVVQSTFHDVPTFS